MAKHYSEFMPTILININHFEESASEGTNSPFSACVDCLCKVNETLVDAVVPMYTEFIDSNLP